MATPTTLPATFVAGNVLTAAQMNDLRGAFRVLQVVSTEKTDTFTTSSTSFTDVTGLTVSITPSATSSKILVIGSITASNDQNVVDGGVRLARGGTGILVGAAAGSRSQGMYLGGLATASGTLTYGMSVLDSPATTSATTYSFQVRNNSAGTFYVNRSKNDTDNASHYRSASSITVMEISA